MASVAAIKNSITGFAERARIPAVKDKHAAAFWLILHLLTYISGVVFFLNGALYNDYVNKKKQNGAGGHYLKRRYVWFIAVGCWVLGSYVISVAVHIFNEFKTNRVRNVILFLIRWICASVLPVVAVYLGAYPGDKWFVAWLVSLGLSILCFVAAFLDPECEDLGLVDTLLAIAISVMLTRLKAKWWGICMLAAVLGGGRVCFPCFTRALVDRYNLQNPPAAGLEMQQAENAGDEENENAAGEENENAAAGGAQNQQNPILAWIPPISNTGAAVFWVIIHLSSYITSVVFFKHSVASHGAKTALVAALGLAIWIGVVFISAVALACLYLAKGRTRRVLLCVLRTIFSSVLPVVALYVASLPTKKFDAAFIRSIILLATSVFSLTAAFLGPNAQDLGMVDTLLAITASIIFNFHKGWLWKITLLSFFLGGCRTLLPPFIQFLINRNRNAAGGDAAAGNQA